MDFASYVILDLGKRWVKFFQVPYRVTYDIPWLFNFVVT
jgi:hypothetical protein